MWDRANQLSSGRISLRKYFMLVTSFIVAIFMLNTSVPASAQTAEVAYRSGDNLVYQRMTFTPGEQTTADDPRSSVEGLHVFNYLDEQAGEAHLILISKGSDPKTAKFANYRVVEYAPPAVYGNQIRGPTSISISSDPIPAEDAPEVATTDETGTPPACSGEATQGMGWIICPVTNFLANGMDNLFKMLTNFLVVQPAVATQDNPLYEMWLIVRDIANVLFIIAFLFMVYSQLTSFGLSNYGIKKVLPRLVVAAVLVNVSYWICALGIDLSNLLGYHVYNFFIGMYNSVVSESTAALTWAETAGAVLGGGAAIGVGGYALGIAVTGGAIAMLLPILLTVLLAAIVAIVLLAARQAIITIFIIISPLAFVAFILPNTEKWFGKWKDTFMTMLLLFPIFAAIFGGAQLAGAAIIEAAAAQGTVSVITIIFGLAVQVAPVVVTPLLIKFSGSLLGRIAGMVNNPNKGLVDRARNAAGERADAQRAKVLGGEAGKNWFGDRIRRVDEKKSLRARHKKLNEDRFQTWLNREGSAGERLFNEEKDAERDSKQNTDRMASARYDRISRDSGLLTRELEARITADDLAVKSAKIDSLHEEAKSGKGGDLIRNYIGERAYNTAEELYLTSSRKQMATDQVSKRINAALLSDGAIKETDANGNEVILGRRTIDGKNLQAYAAGVGEQRVVLAREVQKDNTATAEIVKAMDMLLNRGNLSSSQWQKLAATGDAVVNITDSEGNNLTFSADDKYVKEAAIMHQAVAGSAGQKKEIMHEMGANVQIKDEAGNVIGYRKGINYEHRDTITQEFMKSGISKLIPYVSDITFDEMGKGNINGKEDLLFHAWREIYEDRLKPEVIAGANDGAMQDFFDIGKFKNSKKPEERDLYESFKAKYRKWMSETFEDDQRDKKLAEWDSKVESGEVDALFDLQFKKLRQDAYDITGEDGKLRSQLYGTASGATRKVLSKNSRQLTDEEREALSLKNSADDEDDTE